MAPKFGVFVPQTETTGLAMVAEPAEKCEAMFRTAREAEQIGFDSIWVADHLQPSGATYFECWTTVAALARETHSVTIGQMATCVAFRSPALLAKIAASVDQMSQGRLIVGLGAGWAESEHVAYGFDYGPTNGYRLERLREAVEVLEVMWSDEDPSYSGDIYTVDHAMNQPKPWQKPRPPIWIAGGGEQVTLRLVAKYADGCNVFGRPATVARKLAVLREHCAEIGRDYDSIAKSTVVNMAVGSEEEQERAYDLAAKSRLLPNAPLPGGFRGTPEEATERIRGLVESGITHFIFGVPNLAQDGALEKLAAIVRAV
jgi:F420-dependent oxidoreductase-like protein